MLAWAATITTTQQPSTTPPPPPPPPPPKPPFPVVHARTLKDPNVEVKVGKDGKPVAYVSPPGSPGATPAATPAMNGGQQLQVQAGMEANVHGPGGMPSNPGMQVNGTFCIICQSRVISAGSVPQAIYGDVDQTHHTVLFMYFLG